MCCFFYLGCGELFAFDLKNYEYVHYTSRGPSCPKCTKRFRNIPLDYQVLEKKYNTSKNILCDACEMPILYPKTQAYIFPYDIHLCNNHPLFIRQMIIDKIKQDSGTGSSSPSLDPLNPSISRRIILMWIHDICREEMKLIEKRKLEREDAAYQRALQKRKTLQELQLFSNGYTRIAHKNYKR